MYLMIMFRHKWFPHFPPQGAMVQNCPATLLYQRGWLWVSCCIGRVPSLSGQEPSGVPLLLLVDWFLPVALWPNQVLERVLPAVLQAQWPWGRKEVLGSGEVVVGGQPVQRIQELVAAKWTIVLTDQACLKEMERTAHLFDQLCEIDTRYLVRRKKVFVETYQNWNAFHLAKHALLIKRKLINEGKQYFSRTAWNFKRHSKSSLACSEWSV